ncbi:MAG: DUF2156 domain-containing protein [Myxococcales bacterium]|nr:DUF2156 domain-containing protein [Myxococcales bacterium]
MSSDADQAALVRAIEAHGRDAVAFQGLEPGLKCWRDGDAAVAYFDTGGAWVAAGGPHAPVSERAAVAARFVAAARAAGRRASLFAVDDVDPWPGFNRTLLGEQPVWVPAQWDATVRAHRSLREQLRRARAKGVRVRRVTAAELAPGTALRAELDAITHAWLTGRHMEPMGFLVALAPFDHAEAHRYFVAERHGHAVAYLSLVPVPGRDGWLLEDLIRGGAAPNGTSESLVDAALRELAADGATYATTGMAPLTGGVPRWMRWLGRLGGALYDFEGLRRFKQRLHPPGWERVWLYYPAGQLTGVHVLDGLRAFAGGSLIAFGARTIVRHPGALAWTLGVPLVPWAITLAVVATHGSAGWFGYSAARLGAWAAYDAVLALGLWRASRHPRRRLLGVLASAATIDAVASTLHLTQIGFGGGVAPIARLLAAVAPTLGALGLWVAFGRVRRR